MKKTFLIYFLCICTGLFLYAQDVPLQNQDDQTHGSEDSSPNNDNNDLINIWGNDIDSIFNNTTEDIPESPGNTTINLRDKITLEASYGFMGGFSPGWNEVPWYDGKKDYDYILGAKMEALLIMDFPLTNELRVHNSFYFSLPDSAVFSIKEFYFEYDFKDIVFLKAGLYEIAWGISRFYPFTNLPALVPSNRENWGDSYIIRFTIPVGIGGFDFIAMTRWGFMDNSSIPQFNEFGYGIKYNLAMQSADIDAGFLFHKDLPFRFFVSLKTTLGNTEVYSEGLVAFSYEDSYEVHFSGNIGFLQDFFKGNLTLSGEIFYNGEPDSAWWRTKTDLLEEGKVNLYPGLNGALAFIFRPGFLGMRIFAQALYTYEENSLWLIPGISIKFHGITISASTPMALGKRTEINDKSNYYHDNSDKHNRPFSIVLGITYNGKLKYTL